MKKRLSNILKISLLACFLIYSEIAFCQDNTYEVYALKFAERDKKIPNAARAVGSTSKDSTEVYFSIWLLKGKNGKMILVDAGFTDTTAYRDIIYISPVEVLKRIGVKSEDITDIIVSHPHWDHIGGIHLFPNAMVWMQKDDYDYFVGDAWQEKEGSLGFNKDDVLKVVRRNVENKLTLVKGDDLEILPGIKVYIGSKHTKESQYVSVNNGSQKLIIASDNCWFYYNLQTLLPIPFTLDSKAYVNGLKRMMTMVKNMDLIIPGHDPLVFSKFPKVAEGVVKIEK